MNQWFSGLIDAGGYFISIKKEISFELTTHILTSPF
jgi:hypothetical protein